MWNAVGATCWAHNDRYSLMSTHSEKHVSCAHAIFSRNRGLQEYRIPHVCLHRYSMPMEDSSRLGQTRNLLLSSIYVIIGKGLR